MKKLLLKISIFAFLGMSSTYAQINNSSEDEMVCTPAGKVIRSKVHYVDSYHYLNIKNGVVKLIDAKTGAVAKGDNNIVNSNRYSENDKSNLKNKKINSITPVDNGWVTYSYWKDSSITPITYFSTNWVVPSPPPTDSGQTVFLFNALEANLHGLDSNFIVQPVLQWGPSAAGGGSYWAIADWFGPDSTGNYYHDSLIQVNSGDNLQGVIKLTSVNGKKYSYNSSFAGVSGSGLQVNNLRKADWAYETLEVYNIAECTEYPADTVMQWTDIQIKTDSIYPALIWTPQNTLTDFGQETTIISNSSTNGEVDTRFHTPCLSVGIENIPDVAEDMLLYPNPAENIITINSSGLASIEITNVQGQLMESIKTIGNKIGINVSAFPSGVYVVEVKTANSIEVKKLVKK